MSGILASALPRAADRRLLPEGRLAGPMPWVLAIMLFLTTLAAATGMALGSVARELGTGLANRATIQVVEADPAARERQAAALVRALDRDPAVRAVRRIGAEEIAALLAPWLGRDGTRDLPVPALIDVRLARNDTGLIAALGGRIRRVAPAAALDDHQAALAPVASLVATLRWLALALCLLMTLATGCVVVLAARAALDTHRGTIDVMHLLGATDVQIARLFQHRIAVDALIAGAIGLGGGAMVVAVLGRRLEGLGSELVGSATLLAMLSARWTVLRALRRIL